MKNKNILLIVIAFCLVLTLVGMEGVEGALTDGLVASYSLNTQNFTTNIQTKVVDNLLTNNGTLVGKTFNNGAVSGGVTISDGAMVFDGVDDYVSIAHNDIFENSERTLCAWVYPREVKQQDIISKGNSASTGIGFRLYAWSDGKFYATAFDESGNSKSSSFSSYTTDNWYFVCAIQNSTTLFLNVNGVDGTKSTINGYSNGTATLRIGRLTTSSTFFFNGSIDDVQIYNRALTSTEITAQYNLGRGKYANTGSGLVAQYSGRDYAGTTASPTTIYDTNHLTEGKPNQAFGFDGVDDYVNSTINVNNTLKNGAFTISLWMKPTSEKNGQKAYSGDNSGVDRFYVGSQSGGSNTTLIVGLSSWNPTFTNQFTIGSWQHITVSYNGSHGFVYRDGTLIGSGAVTTINMPSKYLFIGKGEGSDSHFNGSIDNVNIWNRTLSQEEITGLYRSGLGLEYPLFNPNVTIISSDYNEGVLEYTTQRINITIEKSVEESTVVPTLIYDGVVYDTGITTTTNGSQITYSKSLVMEEVAPLELNETFSFYWVFDVIYGGNSNSQNSSTYNQTVYKMVIQQTNSSGAMLTMTFTCRDEKTDALVNCSIIPTFNVWDPANYGVSGKSRSYTLANSSNTSSKDYYKLPVVAWAETNNTEVKTKSTTYVKIKEFDVDDYVSEVVNQIRSEYSTATATCRVVYTYDDASTFEIIETKTGTGWTTKTYTNPYPSKEVDKIEIYLKSSSTSRNASERNTNINQFLSRNPFSSDMIIYASADGYQGRTISFKEYELSTLPASETLYLLNTADGIYVSFVIVSPSQQPLSGAFVKVEKMDNLVCSGFTDDSGILSCWLDPNIAHVVTATKTGYTSWSGTITPTQSSYTIRLGVTTTPTPPETSRDVSFRISPNLMSLQKNTEYLFWFNITSSYWALEESGFNLTDGTNLLASVSGNEGGGQNHSYLLNTTNYSYVVMRYYYIVDGEMISGTMTWNVRTEYQGNYSIATLFEDIKLFSEDEAFGGNGSFTLAIIAFAIILGLVGYVSYKSGIYSVDAIGGLVVALVWFFYWVGFIPAPINAVPYLIPALITMAYAGYLIWEYTK